MRIALGVLTAIAAFGQSAPDFEREVQPVFRKRCSGCHGASKQTNGLRLDDRDAAMKGGYAGAVIVPGKSAESALMHRVLGQKGLMAMPPGKRLDEAEVAVLRSWIDAGAKWPDALAKPKAGGRRSDHWSFQTVKRPALPEVKNTQWARNAVDRFVLARLEKEGIQPSPEADKATLLRRVTLDLTGLPPTAEEMRAFLADQRADAYERVVERLLASPHYAERWARAWLDTARYADSDGYEKDWGRPYAWRYRQWVIEAFDRDMPFDEFTRLQLAGDLVANANAETRVATGFHRMTLTNREGGVDSEQFRFEATLDRALTTGSVWLGLTMGCAQCHDHKYDPITQKDTYQMFAFFDNASEVDIDAPMAGELGPYLAKKDEYRAKRDALLKEYNVAGQMAAWEKEMLYTSAHPGERTDWDLAWDCLLKLTEGGDGERVMRMPAAKRTQRDWDVLTDHFIRNYHFAVGSKKWKELKLDELDKKLRALYAEYPQLTQAMTLAELDAPRQVHLRIRGDYKANGIAVEPGTPGFLPEMKAGGRASRLDLANWLVSEENPLTARVTVNRVWQEYFGTGIVKTAEDFGTQGDAPSHAELLDYLASEFRGGGWKWKPLHRLIVTSATYRQASHTRQDLEEKDPNNRLLARQSRLRLPAESVRDAALFAAGLIDLRVGGPSVKPPQPKGVSEISYGFGWGGQWVDAKGADRYRRGLYIHFQRTTPYPLLMNFDAPKGSVTACRRLRSNTPLQALNLLNDPVFLEAAQALGWQVARGVGSFEERLERAYVTALGRKPGTKEAARLRAYWDQQKAIFDREPQSMKALRAESVEEAAWIGVASVLLNLDEFITRE
ncbi:MAG: PSD1 domain-containing protein [Bryobacterales bacterium]|nr:PSD1 domain-containing protein [Bryobacterales bacterium]